MTHIKYAFDYKEVCFNFSYFYKCTWEQDSLCTSEQAPLSTSEQDPLSTSTNLFYSILSLTNTFWNNVKKQQTVQILLTLLKRQVGTVDDNNLYVFTLAISRSIWTLCLAILLVRYVSDIDICEPVANGGMFNP